MLRSKGVSVEGLRTGMRMMASGKVGLTDTLLKRPPAGAEKLRRIYDSAEEDE